MWRKPTSRASRTIRVVSLGSTLNTPKPSCGIVWPSLRAMLGTEFVIRTPYGCNLSTVCIKPEPRRGNGREKYDRRSMEHVQITFPPELPVSQRREDIARTIRDNQVVCLFYTSDAAD